MAQYQEAFTGKLDWAMPFQRSGGFPLDRSSIFESYADALAYAKQDLTDKRKLGATSYVGQLIVVYGNDAGVTQEDGSVKYTQEVAGYIITAVGESASLMKLAQTTATGDFAADITALNTAVGALEARIKTLEDKPEVVDTDTTYEFTNDGVSTDGAIKITAKNPDNTETTKEVQVKGWNDLNQKVDNVANIAAGKTKSYVYKNAADTSFITAATQTKSFKVGDIIYFTDTNIPDFWVSEVLTIADSETSYLYKFSNLEATKVDLTSYATKDHVSENYTTKSDFTTELNKKATVTSVNELAQTVTDNKSASDTAFGTVNETLQGLQTQINNIDVSSQIEVAITALDVDEVGGNGKYIKAIKEVDGKIVAVAEAMPDYTDTYDAKGAAADALNEAQTYINTKVGDIGEDTSVKAYVDTAVGETNAVHVALAGRVKAIEDAKFQTQINTINTAIDGEGGVKARLTAVEATASDAKSIASNAQSRVATLEGTVAGHTTAIGTLQTEVANRVKTIQLGGVAQTMTAEGVVNITSVSTDLLTTGSKTLVLDCLNASLTDDGVLN